MDPKVLAAFTETNLTTLNNGERFEVDASLKDAFRKAGMFAKHVKGKLRQKLANFHTHEVHKHEKALSKATPNTHKHLFHDTMSKFHQLRLSHTLSGQKHEIHKTVDPLKIHLERKRNGQTKPPASKAEQAAHQHHMEQHNSLAKAHNEAKEHGFDKVAENTAKAADEHKARAKSITRRRSMPKTEEVKMKGRGKYVRTDAHKEAIKNGKAKAKAAREAAKAEEEKKAKKPAKKITKKVEDKEEKPATKRPRKTTVKKAEEAPKKETKKPAAKKTKAEPATEEKTAPKKRGRPAGSKNKPKEPVKEEKTAKKPAAKKTTTRKKTA